MAAASSLERQTTQEFAEFAATLRFDELPAGTVSSLKRMILDSLGTALAATTLGDGCREVMSVMSGLGGKPESTVLTLGKVAAPHAAFANGALVHALNYDPIGAEIGHLGVVCLAAPLAVAEAAGGVSGATFLAASAAACEVTARVTAAISRAGRRPSEKFLSGQLLNYFGAAAGAGRILNLDAAQMQSALGMALMQMAGSRQIVLNGDPPAKAIYGAFPNQAGVLAALLSKAGLDAQCDVFGEPCGLYPMIYGGDCDRETLTSGLGMNFLLEDVEFKPWPASNQIHPFIEAAINLRHDGLVVSDIVEVTVLANSQLRAWCEPLNIRRSPENAAAAANSIPFCVAAALAHGRLTLSDFTPDGLKHGQTRAIADRVSYRLENGLKGAQIAVKIRDGHEHVARVETPLGHRSRPMTDADLEAKFRDCCSHAATRPRAARVTRLIEMVRTLEDLDDVGQLVALASGADR